MGAINRQQAEQAKIIQRQGVISAHGQNQNNNNNNNNCDIIDIHDEQELHVIYDHSSANRNNNNNNTLASPTTTGPSFSVLGTPVRSIEGENSQESSPEKNPKKEEQRSESTISMSTPSHERS